MLLGLTEELAMLLGLTGEDAIVSDIFEVFLVVDFVVVVVGS